MKSLAKSVRAVSDKSFKKKFVALGRVLSLWPQIVGSEFAGHTTPVAVKSRKTRDGFLKTLVIGVPPALSTKLHYQKGLILERIGRLLGDDYIHDIRFVDQPPKEGETETSQANTHLTETQKEHLTVSVKNIEDSDLKTKLEKFGKSLMTAINRKKGTDNGLKT